ncbi:MAG: hypothetical protein Q9227_001223 [Pyrenula ochraceoflavens]
MSQQYASKQPAGFKNHIEKVAIVGVGGQSGKKITDALVKAGKHKLTAITRADSTTAVPAGVTAAKVNYDDPSSIVEALKGHDALVITMSVMAPPDSQAKLIEAAAAAKIPWVIPNEYGSDVSKRELSKDILLGAQYDAGRAKIQELGVSSFVGINCSFWYEYSLSFTKNAYGFDMQNKEVTFYDDGNTKLNTSTLFQTGRAVASLLSLPILPKDENDTSVTLDSFRNKSCYVSSFFISQKDMFESVLRVTGDKREDWTIKYEPSNERFERGKEIMKTGDRSGFGMLLYARVLYPDGSGDFNDKLDNDKLGLPKDDLDEMTKLSLTMKPLERY